MDHAAQETGTMYCLSAQEPAAGRRDAVVDLRFASWNLKRMNFKLGEVA